MFFVVTTLVEKMAKAIVTRSKYTAIDFTTVAKDTVKFQY